jgi:zinc transporter, ZIP family
MDLEALGWGALAASSLVIGALLGVARRWRRVVMGCVLGFGAGALIASVSFELARKGVELAGQLPVAVGLMIGALTFFVASLGVERLARHSERGGSGMPLALGALLDGIPEQAVLGIGLARGDGVSIALLAAVFISNLPEAVGSASDLKAAGWSRRSVILLWTGVAAICTLATLGGARLADVAHPPLEGAINGFAAGALLVMLANEMIPEAQTKGGKWAGLATVLGFAVAAGFSHLTS